jgi:hypothetical protein
MKRRASVSHDSAPSRPPQPAPQKPQRHALARLLDMPLSIALIATFLTFSETHHFVQTDSAIHRIALHSSATPMLTSHLRRSPVWLTQHQYRALSRTAKAEAELRPPLQGDPPVRRHALHYLAQTPSAFRVELAGGLTGERLRADMPIGHLRITGIVAIREPSRSALPLLIRHEHVRLQTFESNLLPAAAVLQALLQHADTLREVRIIMHPGVDNYKEYEESACRARHNGATLGSVLPRLSALEQLSLSNMPLERFYSAARNPQLLQPMRLCIQRFIASLRQQQQAASRIHTLRLIDGVFTERELGDLVLALLPQLRALTLYRSVPQPDDTPAALAHLLAITLLQVQELILYPLQGSHWEAEMVQRLIDAFAASAQEHGPRLRMLAVYFLLSADTEPIIQQQPRLAQLASLLPQLHIHVSLQQLGVHQPNAEGQSIVANFRRWQQQLQSPVRHRIHIHILCGIANNCNCSAVSARSL